MSPTKGRKNLLRSLLKAHLSLGCGCSDSNLGRSDVYQPMPKPGPRPSPSPSSSSSDGGKTSATFSPAVHYCSDGPGPGPSEQTGSAGGASPADKIEGSIPVVKESEDPYEDFRESMMQMIMEKEIYTQEDLHHLLRRFLRLNAAAHRPLILRAFVDVCHSLVSDLPEDQNGAGNRRHTCEEQPSSSPM